MFNSLVKSLVLAALLLGVPPLVWAQSGSIQLDPSPCQIPNGGTTCLVNISWQTSGVSQPGLFWGTTLVGYGTVGTYSPDWINASGYTFDLRALYSDPNSALLDSKFVYGVPPASGSISASPNPCQIPAGQSTCTVNISWTASNTPQQPGLFWGTTLVGYGTSGTYSTNWIDTGGYVFTLRTNYADPNSTQLDSVTAYGVASSQPSGSVSAPGCSIPTFSSSCSSTITWQTSNAPLAGLFRNGSLVATGTSGSYSDNAVTASGTTYAVLVDYSNSGSTQLAAATATGQPFAPVDLRSYFPVATNTYRLAREDGFVGIRYNFFVATSDFQNLYNTYFNLNKPGQLLIWQKVVSAPPGSQNLNCTVTYGHLYTGGGSDHSVVEVGDWLNGNAQVLPDGTCPNQFYAFGYQPSQTFALPATGINWSGANGLTSSIGSSYQQGFIFANANQDPNNSYVSSTQMEFSDPVLIEVLSTWQAPWGRNGGSPNGWGSPGQTYTNVVRMILYHGTTGSNTCQGQFDPTNPWQVYFRHYSGFQTYAQELYMDQQHGILQFRVLYDEGGGLGGCGAGLQPASNIDN